jgi:glycosyltransferase involved in cell wall biosynthesis
MRAARSSVFNRLGQARTAGTEARFRAPEAVGNKRGPPPTFSVVIAAYQVADVIGDALDSLRRQTVRPLEVIVCDDGSTDDLDAAVQPFLGEIILLRKENGGEASAKNAAAFAARGDFVVILDADDVFLPGRLAALSELAQERPELDILTTDAFLVADGTMLRRAYDDTWRFETRDQRRAILAQNFIFGLAAVRRSRLLEHGGFDESILWTTDWDLWLRMIVAGSRAGCVDEPLALYRLRETSLTAKRRNLLLGKLATLEKALHNPALEDVDRAVVERSLAAHRGILDLLDLRTAVAAGETGARSRALELLRAPGYSVRSRLDVAVMAAAPRTAGRILRRRAEAAWTGAGGTRVPRR